MTTLTTPRLLLRPWCIFDTPDLFDYASDPAVADMAGWPVYTSVDQAREFIEGTLIPKQSFAIELCETGKVIGNIALLNTVFSRAFTSLEAREVAFSLSHKYWGNRLMSEALEAVLRHAFCDLSLDFVCCGRFEDNERCESLMRKYMFIRCISRQSDFVRTSGNSPRELISLLTYGRFLRAVNDIANCYF